MQRLEVSGAVRPIYVSLFVKRLTNLMHKIFFYNKFIIRLYMFRALLCSSSGGQNYIIQPLVSSHTVGGRPVCRLRGDCAPDGHLQV